jgi:hypothetical protein
LDSIASTVPGAVVTLLRDQPLSPGKVQCAWTVAVGPALQRASAVQLEGGRLLVDAVNAQWAREIRRAAPVILNRVRALLGNDVVTDIVVRS